MLKRNIIVQGYVAASNILILWLKIVSKDFKQSTAPVNKNTSGKKVLTKWVLVKADVKRAIW